MQKIAQWMSPKLIQHKEKIDETNTKSSDQDAERCVRGRAFITSGSFAGGGNRSRRKRGGGSKSGQYHVIHLQPLSDSNAK